MYYLLQLVCNTNFNYILLVVAVLYYLFSYLILKKTVFKFLFINSGRKNKLLLIGVNIFLYLLVILLNNAHDSKYSFLGIKYYPYNIHLNVDKNIKRKIDFINKNSTSAKDYIINLFDKYDVVVLGERLHFENTQWDLIYDIVSDKRFIEQSGNIFTELGSDQYQYLADEYFKTKYKSKEELDKATTRLIYLANGFTEKINYFNFFERLYELNLKLPDSLKIRENFTSINLYPLDIKTRDEYIKYSKDWNHYYDSIMADNVIKGYYRIQKEEKRKKCLVITNSRHSYNLSKYKFKDLKNETTYIFDSLGDKVANVMINSVCAGRKNYSVYFLGSHNNGTWDKAFELCGNKSIGFDLKTSPFGKDQFDMNMNYSNFKYEDIYTGFIFYKSKFDWVNMAGKYPYEQEDNFIEEYKRRMILHGYGGLDKYIYECRKSKDYNKFVPNKVNPEFIMYTKPNSKIFLFQFIFILSNFFLIILIIRDILVSRK